VTAAGAGVGAADWAAATNGAAAMVAARTSPASRWNPNGFIVTFPLSP
jgi:hypothetical protein